jgi:MATE family, multidrug efflux pump
MPELPIARDARAAELRATVALAIPVVTVQVGMMAMGAVDTLMVGHVSARVLAAVALGNLYFFNVSVFGIGTLMALDPVVAQAIGARDADAVTRAMQRGLLLVGVLSVFAAILLAPASQVLTALHQPPEIIPDASRYLRLSIVGIVPFFAFVVFRQSLQAMGRLAPIVWTIVVANVANAGLNWVFVYGHLGSPALGAAGSAIATLVSRTLMTGMLLYASWGDLRGHLLSAWDESLALRPLWRMLRLGLPIGVQQTLESAAFGAIGLLMGVFGVTQVAAHQVAITLVALTFMVPLGVGAAAAVRVGHAIGAGDEARVRAAVRAAYLCGTGFMVCTAVGFLVFPTPLARAFTQDRAVWTIAATLIPIAGIFQVFDGAQAVGAGVLRGIGDTTAPLVVMLAAYWLIGVPVSAYLGFRTDMGPPGLWWGFVFSLAAVAIFLYLRIRVLFRRSVRRVAID